MNEARFKSIYQGQTAIAKKVYDAVPISEPWPLSKIHTEMVRLHGFGRDLRIIEGCVNTLVNAGIVDEPERGQFLRTTVHIKANKPAEIKLMHNQAKTYPPVPADEPDVIDQLTELSKRALQLASSLKTLATDLDNAALDITAQMQENEEQTKKFKQLQALLKGLS